ncbi:MAG: hypothetical protein M3Y28_04050, partial [Armatimonadota bacterium]|nr:hypothetical protein [Armatimonadota bacterium]
MQRQFLLGVALGAVLAFFATSALAKSTSPVRVTRETYRGWPGAYRLSNGVVDVVVVPQIGRVMAFQFTGRVGTSP